MSCGVLSTTIRPLASFSCRQRVAWPRGDGSLRCGAHWAVAHASHALSERGITSPSVSLGELLTGRRPPLRGGGRVRLADYAHEIVAWGFPGMRFVGARALKFQLDSYLRNAVDGGAEQELAFRKPDAMLGWLRAYAAATSTAASYSAVLDAATAGVSDKPGVERLSRTEMCSLSYGCWTRCLLGGPRETRWRAWPNRRSTIWPIQRWRRVYSACPWMRFSAVKAGRSVCRLAACSGIS